MAERPSGIFSIDALIKFERSASKKPADRDDAEASDRRAKLERFQIPPDEAKDHARLAIRALRARKP